MEKNQYYKNELMKLGIDGNILPKFDINYYDSILKDISELLSLKKNNFSVRYGDEKHPAKNTYLSMKQKLNDIQLKMKQYTENEKYYIEVSKKIEQTKIEIEEIENQIIEIKALNTNEVQKERIKLYKQIFEEILKKKKTLESLYRPLIEQLQKNEQEAQLGFFVKINVDIKSWIADGSKLIDLRKAGELYENKILLAQSYDKLYNAWINCDIDLIEKAIDDYTNNEAKKMVKMLLGSSSLVDLADWLFSIDHISISYEMKFNNIPLKLLSPGTKGILLMLLYLGVDKNDSRPLLIDQPEDNLDPESVYNVLVPYFKEAKKRRQIIMVTHNPNLVVGTDSDQVIVASIKSNDIGKLPTFIYLGGGLENPEIINKVCSILEGGKDAFEKREERYKG